MWYEINVSKKNSKGMYIHFFATAKRSVTLWVDLRIVYNAIKSAFPEPEFKVDITKWEEIGHGIDPETI
jgi:uncharacterized protein (DUF736 family)